MLTVKYEQFGYLSHVIEIQIRENKWRDISMFI